MRVVIAIIIFCCIGLYNQTLAQKQPYVLYKASEVPYVKTNAAADATLNTTEHLFQTAPSGKPRSGSTPANDDICNATTYASCLTDNNGGASSDYFFNTGAYCLAAGTPYVTLWYSFQTGVSNDAANVQVTSLGAIDNFYVILYEDTCTSPIGISAACGNSIDYDFTLLQPNTTYYLMVGTKTDDTGAFNLCITPFADTCVNNRPINDSICSAAPLSLFGTCITNQNIQCASPDFATGCISVFSKTLFYEFALTPGNSKVSLDLSANTFPTNSAGIAVIEADSCDGLNSSYVYYDCPDLTNPIVITGLSITKQYFVMVAADQGNEGTFSICAWQDADYCDTTTAPGPMNDSICGSIALSGDTCVTSQSNRCTSSPEYYAGCFSPDLSVVWYQIKITDNKNTLNVTLNNTTFTAGQEVSMELLKGANCDSVYALHSVFCGPDSGIFSFRNVEENADYWLGIGTPVGNQGSFDVCIAQSLDVGTLSGAPQDCETAIELCSDVYVQTGSYIGAGNKQELLAGVTCIGTQETNSVWFTFTPKDSGAFGFILQTANDYDFALYNITDDGCQTIPQQTPVRCNWCFKPGPTGIDVNNPSTNTNLNEPGSNPCDSIMPGIFVKAGERYALFVDNYTADNNGFLISFEGASIGDTTSPKLVSAEPNCDTSSFRVYTSQSINCSSITKNDFELIDSASGADLTPSILDIQGYNCNNNGNGNGSTSFLDVTYNNHLPLGTYYLRIKSSGVISGFSSCGTSFQHGSQTTVHLDTLIETESYQTGCDSVSSYGNTYYSSGNYSISLPNASGCDTLHTLHATVNKSVFMDGSVTGCDSAFVFGNWIYSDTTIHEIFMTTEGCDSIQHAEVIVGQEVGYISGSVGSSLGVITEGKVQLLNEMIQGIPNPIIFDSVSLDVNGQFSFSGLAPGRYTIRVMADPSMYPNPVVTYHSSSAFWEYADVIELSACNDTFNLLPTQLIIASGNSGGFGTGDITGKVVNSGDKTPASVANLNVYLLDPTDKHVVYQRKTDSDGNFNFLNIGLDEYHVTLDQPGYILESSVNKTVQLGFVNNDIYVELCLDSVDYEVVVCEVFIQSVGKDVLQQIQIVPNPSQGIFELKSSIPMKEICIRDVSGKIVNHISPSNIKTQVDVSSLPKGIYLIEIQTKKGIARKKLVLMDRDN